MNMEEKLFNPGRRAVLAKILAGGALGITGMSGIIRHALAVGGETYPQGISAPVTARLISNAKPIP